MKTRYDAGRTMDIPEYGVWRGIKRRCEHPTDHKFRYYGARGIRMCERWSRDFNAFMADMGRRPSALHSIDRIDNDGNYEPGNCRWATHTQQMRNTRKNKYVTVDDKTMTVAEWSETSGIHASLISRRLRSGWSARDAVTVQPGLGFIVRALGRAG